MISIGEMSHEELAAYVCQALADAGITVTLTGGACVAIWSAGGYESLDLDFIESGLKARRDIRRVLTRLGFTEERRYFRHSDTQFVIEFPSGPLAVGDQPVGSIAERTSRTGTLRLLTPTDCVKDRLAAWFHWRDRQALDQAILVATRQAVDLQAIEQWALQEAERPMLDAFLDGYAKEVQVRN